MKLSIALIRHGGDFGDFLVGKTDKHLSSEDARALEDKAASSAYPGASIVFSSGLSRCLETANIIYSGLRIEVMDALRALDYGDFEGKSPAELQDNPEFMAWVAKASASAPPAGESPYALTARSIAVFGRIASKMAEEGIASVAIVSHKLVIASILQRFVVPRSRYGEWKIACGYGFSLVYDTETGTAEIVGKF